MVEKIAGATIRRQIISCLADRPMNAIEISQHVGIMEKEVYVHLSHIGRSVAAQGKKLVIHPSRCLSCGFIFEKRERFSRPGRCPLCRETRIKRPAYEIEEKT
jgi:predicted Zn-ribbon and HTH transcriptional regulator